MGIYPITSVSACCGPGADPTDSLKGAPINGDIEIVTVPNDLSGSYYLQLFDAAIQHHPSGDGSDIEQPTSLGYPVIRE